jgi:hypothetical protein
MALLCFKKIFQMAVEKWADGGSLFRINFGAVELRPVYLSCKLKSLEIQVDSIQYFLHEFWHLLDTEVAACKITTLMQSSFINYLCDSNLGARAVRV